ncbi:MAG: hypothetical protein ACI36V_04895, partial [Coriobacteriales bacterium]
KAMIAKLVEAEPKDKPYSDQDICDILNKRGVGIKRRTVAKYRTALGIDSQSARRWAEKARMETA